MTHGREFDREGVYEIRVKGVLDEEWSGWFDGFTIAREVPGETRLTGSVADQAALLGVIIQIAGLGLPLLSVRQIDGQTAAAEPDGPERRGVLPG